jgi:hypothetical protein
MERLSELVIRESLKPYAGSWVAIRDGKVVANALDAVELREGEVIAGSLPRRQLRLVQAWVELHTDELNADWELASGGEPLNPIAPLS